MAGPGVLLRPPRHSIPHKAIPNDGMVGRGGGGNFRRINLRRNVYVGAHIRMCVCEECRTWGKSKRGERGRRRREARSQGGKAAGKDCESAGGGGGGGWSNRAESRGCASRFGDSAIGEICHPLKCWWQICELHRHLHFWCIGSKTNSPDRTLYNLLYICSLQTSSSTLQPIKKTRSRDRNRTRAYSHTA